MKKSQKAALAVATLLAALATTAPLHAQHKTRYIITDLGTLGGTFSQANGINNRGVVTGFSTPPGDMTVHAFRWQNGVMTDLGTLGGPNSFTPDQNHLISPRGAIVGIAETSITDPNGEDTCGDGSQLTCLPFVWQNGKMTALPLLGGNNGATAGINSRGQIVGVAETANADPTCAPPLFLQIEAAIWENGQVHELTPLSGDPDGYANSINDNGQAVGLTGSCVSASHAVLWQNGTPIDLGNLGGVSGNIAFDINNNGQVVGQSDLPGDNAHHAFLWQNGAMADLGTIYNLPVSLANGINNKGQVVGFSQDLNGDTSSTVAWIWQDGKLTDLNTLIAGSASLFLIEALGINDRGQIAGPAVNLKTGEYHGYLATPVEGGEDLPAVGGVSIERSRPVLPQNIRQMIQHRMGLRFYIPKSRTE
jgi:probable HAF family extracellular repeat protein